MYIRSSGNSDLMSFNVAYTMASLLPDIVDIVARFTLYIVITLSFSPLQVSLVLYKITCIVYLNSLLF